MSITDVPVTEVTLADLPEATQGAILFSPAPSLDVPEPQPIFQRMLEEHPRLRWEGGIAFFRMEDVVEGGRNPAITSEMELAFNLMGSREALIPLHVHGTEHRAYRKLLDPLLTPRKMAPLESDVRALADSLIDEFIQDGRVELHDQFAVPLPSQMFLRLFGLPIEDAPLLNGFKDRILKNTEPDPEVRAQVSVAAGDEMRAYLATKIAEREREGTPRDDLLGACMSYEVEGKRLTNDEIMNIAHLFVIAGLDTVTASLSCIIGWLARHPDEQARLRADPSLVPSAIEELMRWENPVLTSGGRFALADTEVNGVPVKAGDFVTLCWSTANLDPGAFDDPGIVDLERTGNRHVAFAAGMHRCLGSHLARLELRTAVDQFHRRVGRYWITEGDQPHYNHAGVRAAEHLPISFEGR